MNFDNLTDSNILEIIFNPELNKENKLRILGKKFVNNNKNKCKIKYEDKEYELNEYFDIKNYKNKDKIEIKLIGINNITNMEYMFHKCTNLISLPDIDKIDTSKVNNIYSLFSYCESLTNISDISKWNISNVTDISNLFNYCESLTSLPDISKWNTIKVTNMSYMLYECKLLESLPDISKWNTNKEVVNMKSMFDYCYSLKKESIPMFYRDRDI